MQQPRPDPTSPHDAPLRDQTTQDHDPPRDTDADRCREHATRSVGLAALHNEELGFLGAAELAKEAIETGKTVGELVEAGDAPGAEPEKSRV